jgi:3-oxoacyl-[acyl-carrier protein] reductase
MRPIEGMSILVTGGGSGLGEGMARHFTARGAKVTISGRRADRIDAVARDIGAGCAAVAGDVTNAADRTAMVERASAHGGGLDLLVNNAGNMLRQSVAEYVEEDLLEVFHTNVVGGMMLTRAAHEALARSRGCVVFIGSVHNRRAFPGASPYAATKGAVESLTKVLAAELGQDQIRVGCVVPGAVLTEINQRAGLFDDQAAKERLEGMADMHALGRIGTASEIAEAVEYLARAEWTTGAILEVDGGLGLGVTFA